MTVDQNRRAIVTGASQGIGRAIAERLAREGYSLAITARSEIELKALASEMSSKHGADVLAIPADLRDASSADAIVSKAVMRFAGLDLLVNCAGATKGGDFFALTHDDFVDGFALKFYGAVNLTRAAWPHLGRSPAGHVVNIIGLRARMPHADYVIGGAVNAALLNFTKAMADRGLTDGIRVNGINPGLVETERTRRSIRRVAQASEVSEAEAKALILRQAGVTRFGRPEEIAGLVAFMDASEGAYMHGVIVDVDGGANKGA